MSEGPRLVLPGVSPRSWMAEFTGGPIDGERHGLIDVDRLPDLISYGDGRYRLISRSHLPGELDLSGQQLIRGCRYAWEVESRADTPPLPGGRGIRAKAPGER